MFAMSSKDMEGSMGIIIRVHDELFGEMGGDDSNAFLFSWVVA